MNGTMVIELLGGLGLFLYGMKLMGEGIEKVAGSKMKTILEWCTKNRLVGVIVGTIFTAIIHFHHTVFQCNHGNGSQLC